MPPTPTGSPPLVGGLPPIKGFLPTTLIEWEGRITTAVFVAGCNFRCPFCHAREIVLEPNALEDIPLDEVLAHIERQKGWVEGIAISGGEPTIHPGLADLIDVFRQVGLAVKLDTNGSNPGVLKSLIDAGVLAAVAMDVKAPLAESYRIAAGVEVDVDFIQASIDILRQSGIEREFRITVVPGMHSVKDILAVARLLGEGEKLILQQFAPLDCLDPAYNERAPVKRVELRDMAAAAAEFVSECRVRGEV
ncbi:anaerobic ribonucleoside-triphosphate reductase activating protein [bacterium]|nr:anaerobic ribonucleoside-triphosphate reductase activating protein [bacterium]